MFRQRAIAHNLFMVNEYRQAGGSIDRLPKTELMVGGPGGIR